MATLDIGPPLRFDRKGAAPEGQSLQPLSDRSSRSVAFTGLATGPHSDSSSASPVPRSEGHSSPGCPRFLSSRALEVLRSLAPLTAAV